METSCRLHLIRVEDSTMLWLIYGTFSILNDKQAIFPCHGDLVTKKHTYDSPCDTNLAA